MAYLDSAQPAPAKPKDDEGAGPSSATARYWREIEKYEKATSEWKTDGENIVKVYLNESNTQNSPRRFALLWANVETLKPAVYARIPNINCSRRFKDRDPVGRVAAEVLERATNTSFDIYDVDEIFRMVRDDRLLPGRGQAWVRYEAQTQKLADGSEKLVGEKVCVDYVHWLDFGHSLARIWKDVWLAWRKVYLDRETATERFKEKADKLAFTARSPDEKEESAANKAVIYECWDKGKGKVLWLSKEVDEPLDQGPPPLNFRDFFPCPEPCYATKTSKSLIPVPDYHYYRDQAKEINDLTAKIDSLIDWLTLKGFVPSGPSAGGSDAVERAVRESSNEEIIVQVESWQEFVEKGGASKLIDWLPIDKIVQALKTAIDVRAQLIQDVFQITGISDILRGQTDPDETLGAQQLKAQTGSRRLKNAKDELARFCRDIGQLVAEVIAEQFQPETLAAMSGFQYVPVQPQQQPMPGAVLQQPGMTPPVPGGVQPQGPGQTPMAEQQAEAQMTFDDKVIELLRNDRMRGFRIDIETDSTVQPDEDAEKQRRTEFLGAMGTFMQQSMEVLQSAPQMAPMLGEMLMFGVRGFRAGRSLEDTIERSISQFAQTMAQPKPPPPDPKMIEAEQKAKAKQAEMQSNAQLTARGQDIDAQLTVREQNITAEARQREAALKTMAPQTQQ